MKLIFVFTFLCFDLGFTQEERPWAKFTLTVVDEERHPIPEANLKIFWTYNPKGSSGFIRETTDANGRFTYERRVAAAPGIEVEKNNIIEMAQVLKLIKLLMENVCHTGKI